MIFYDDLLRKIYQEIINKILFCKFVPLIIIVLSIFFMIIERTNKEVIIRLLPSVDTDELQELANYFRYKEITSKYKTDQPLVDKISSEINKKWYKQNRERLLK
jgi:hypothetical protein